MNDDNYDPLGAFINNLVGGAKAGYEFRTGNRERAQDRAMEADDRRRRNLTQDEQMQMARARELRAGVAEQLSGRVGEANIANLAADNVRADATARMAASEHTYTHDRNAENDLRANLPTGFNIPSASERRRYIADPSALQADIAAAREGAVGGRQGSYTREGHIGQAGGVLYTPPTLNVNIPASAHGGGRRLTLPERQTRQSADAFDHAVTRMEQLESDDPTVAEISWGAATAADASTSNVPVVGGLIRGVAGPVSQRLMTPGQQEYRNLLNLAVDHYIGTLKIRATNQVMDNLRRNLALQSGQEGGGQVQSGLAETRAYLRQRVRQTAYGSDDGGAPDTGVEGAAPPVPPPADFTRFRPRPR